MIKELWLNLPVKNLAASTAFFSHLGFRFNTAHQTESSACMLVGEKNIVVMLFEIKLFEGFVQQPATDTATSSEVLISIDAQSKAEVDEWAIKVKAAGGHLFSAPASVQGWMYGCGFADLDGHRWNVLYMDTAALSQQQM